MRTSKLFILFLAVFFHTSLFAQSSCLLDTQWEGPTPTVITYGFGAGWLAGVPDPSNMISPTDPKGIFEGYFSPNPGVTAFESIRVGLGSLDDPDDNTRFVVTIYDDDGSGAPGTEIGRSAIISPTVLGVPGAGFFAEFTIDLPISTIPTTAFFHAGVEITAGDGTDVLIVMTSCLGPTACAVAEGEADASNTIFTSGFSYENLLTIYGADLDVHIIPKISGPVTTFTYSANQFYTDGIVDPSPNITGVAGGMFSSSPMGLVIDPVSGVIDVSASTEGNYTVN
jgi:hypothetical protein